MGPQWAPTNTGEVQPGHRQLVALVVVVGDLHLQRYSHTVTHIPPG